MRSRESKQALNKEDTLISLLVWANNKAQDESFYKDVFSEIRSYFPEEQRKKIAPLPYLRKLSFEELKYFIKHDKPFVIEVEQWKRLNWYGAIAGLTIGAIAGALLAVLI